MIPKFKCIPWEYQEKMQYKTHFYIDLAWRQQYVGVFEMEYNGVIFYFIDTQGVISLCSILPRADGFCPFRVLCLYPIYTQGIALGSLVFPLSPCKGKSFKTISRFYLNIEKFTLP